MPCLGLTEERMRADFKKHLENKAYEHGVLAVHAETGEVLYHFTYIIGCNMYFLGGFSLLEMVRC